MVQNPLQQYGRLDTTIHKQRQSNMPGLKFSVLTPYSMMAITKGHIKQVHVVPGN